MPPVTITLLLKGFGKCSGVFCNITARQFSISTLPPCGPIIMRGHMDRALRETLISLESGEVYEVTLGQRVGSYGRKFYFKMNRGGRYTVCVNRIE